MEIQERAVYTTDETAQILKISTVTVERKIRRGEISATKIGKAYRLLGDDILKLFGQNNKEGRKEGKKGKKGKIAFGSYNIGVAANMSRKEMYSDR